MINKRFYKCVSANSAETDSLVIDNGKTLIIKEVGGSAGFLPETVSEIKFGNTLLFSTHGEGSLPIFNYSIVGDGETALTINLYNGTSMQLCMGLWYNAIYWD